MPHQDDDKQYEETVDPKNPPNSVLKPEVRKATLSVFLGGIILLFVIIAAALIFWRASYRHIDPDPGQRDPQAEIGTAGERSAGIDQPGGFNPEPRPGSTRDELEYRGSDSASRSLPLTNVNAVLEDKAETAIGRRVDVKNAGVASAEGGSFWIHDGNAKVQVVPPSGAPAVSAGQKVDVSGTVESDGRNGVRIRADRVTAR